MLVTDGERIKMPGVPKHLEAYRIEGVIYLWDPLRQLHTPLGHRHAGVKRLALAARHYDGLPPYTTTDPAIAAAMPNTFELVSAAADQG